MSAFTESEFEFHRPIDPSDPGFTIKGRKLRWISTKVHQNNPDRPWVTLKKSSLPPGVIKKLEAVRPDFFDRDEDRETIRRGGGTLILAFSSEEARLDHLKEIRERAMLQDQTISRGPDIKDHKGNQRSEVTENKVTDATQEIMARFKTKTEN